MKSIGLSLGLTRGRGRKAIPAPEILKAAQDVGATAVYNPDDAETWTLREDGGTLYYEEVWDGLGNKEPLVQTTASRQPEQLITSTGRRVWTNDGSDKFMLADFAVEITQPNTVFFVGRKINGWFIDGAEASGGRQIINPKMWAGNGFFGRDTLPNFSIAQGNFNSSNSEQYIDGDLSGTGDPGVNNFGGFGIMQRGNSTELLNGQLGLIVLFDSLRTNAELADLRAVINKYYPIGLAA